MELPKDDNTPGLYIAIMNAGTGLYPQSFDFAGDPHESAWGFAERTELFQHPIVCVVPAKKFGNQAVTLFGKMSFNRGCVSR